MYRDYMLFEPDSDHGPSPSDGLTAEQLGAVQARMPQGVPTARYLELLNATSGLYERDCLLRALAAHVQPSQPGAFTPDELGLLVRLFHGETNQHLSWHFARLLVAAGQEAPLIEAARSAPLEVTRLIAAMELKDLLAESFREQSMARYKGQIERALREVILNDASNFVRNYSVAAVLDFEYRYPADFVQFCRQWYLVAARRLGVAPKLTHPYVAGFLGADEASVLAPLRSKPAAEAPGTPARPAQTPPEARAVARPEPAAGAPPGPIQTHNTNERTLKKIKLQQLLSTALLVASVAVALLGNDFGIKAGIAGAAVALVWKWVLIPSQKWWHHG